MVAQTAHILLLTNKGDNWVHSQLKDIHEIVVVPDFQQAVKMLNYVGCDLFMVDAQALDENVGPILKELRHYFPYLPIIVLSESDSETHYEMLMSVGADALLSPDLSLEQLKHHIRMGLNQSIQRRALLARSQKLYIVSSLPLLLADLTDMQDILIQSIQFIVNLFNLEAVAFVIPENGGFRLSYTASKKLLAENHFDTYRSSLDDHHPFKWSMTHQMTQVYNQVSLNSSFDLPAEIDRQCSAVILPFTQPDGRLGSIAFFARHAEKLANEEVFIYEQFVVQLQSVLMRAYQHRRQGRQLDINKRLVDAWSEFAEQHETLGVVNQLCAALATLDRVSYVLVRCVDPQTFHELIADSSAGSLIEALRQSGQMDAFTAGIQTQLPLQLQIIRLNLAQLAEPAAQAARAAFGGHQLYALPLLQSGERIGAVVVADADNHRLDEFDLYLLENLVQIAMQALQRITLSTIVLNNNAQLMTIICSISEGVFYVDESQRVVFCNPQLLEITGISVTDFINQNVDALLRSIAATSQMPQQIYSQLQTAKQHLLNGEPGEYPIVLVPLAEQNVELRVEFARTDRDSESVNWLGIIHPFERSRSAITLNRLMDRVRVGYTQMRGTIHVLAEQHGHFSYGERDEIIKQIEIYAGTLSQWWNQFYQLYSLYLGGLVMQRSTINLEELLGRALQDHRLKQNGGQVKLLPHARTPLISVDEFYFSRALTDLLAELASVTVTPPGLSISIENRAHEVEIVIACEVAPRRFESMEEVLVRIDPISSTDLEHLNLHIAAELIRRNGGQIAVRWTADDAVQVRLTIPAIALSDDPIKPVEPVPAIPTEIVHSAPSREPNSIMVVEGKSTLVKRMRSQLQAADFSILHYDTGEEALRDVNATYFDLIVLDMRLEDEDGLRICKLMRERTETPILLVGDEANAKEKVEGLNAGADDVVTGSVVDEELLARARVIINRRYIAARSREPMQFGDLYVDFAHRAVFLKNNPVELTRIEYDILYTLIVNQGQTVTHKQLLTQVWGPEYLDETQYLWVNISRLRKKLEPNADSPRYIRTQPGVGYYFAVP
ncbi:MAG: response regulator [Aggregatilineales bacterium]